MKRKVGESQEVDDKIVLSWHRTPGVLDIQLEEQILLPGPARPEGGETKGGNENGEEEKAARPSQDTSLRGP